MKDIIRQIDALKLFNEKTVKLLQLSFVKTLSDPKTGILLTGDIKDKETLVFTVTRKGPSQESIDAFVLTFRFFIQDNESSSFHNIANIYETSIGDQFIKELFSLARNSINEFLDSPNKLGIAYNNKRPTNRKIMETFIYGELAHENEEKKKMYEEWMSVPTTAPLFDAAFVFILAEVLNTIHYISILNQYAIDNLKKMIA